MLTPKQFIVKTIHKTIVFTFILVFISALSRAIAPVMSNEIALTQMQNSSEAFVMVGMLDTFKKIIKSIKMLVIIWFVSVIGRDTYKFTKTYKKNKEKN